MNNNHNMKYGLVNRENVKDAKNTIEKFIPNKDTRKKILNFLATEVIYAHKINNRNWNLNLDKNGKFLRFNIGHEYCIQISKESVLILCIKDTLINSIGKEKHSINFLGKNNKVFESLSETPDCLAKVPNSIGCIIKYEKVQEYITKIERANKMFIEYAIKNTSMLPIMKFAHSPSVTKYIKKITNKNIPNPIYDLTYENLKKFNEKAQKELKKLSLNKLENKIKGKSETPQKINVFSTQYLRDPYISEYVKRKAKGICQDCKKPAPFINKKTGEPFLETHHIVSLSQGGNDTVDNVIGLCPNCHRKRHYG